MNESTVTAALPVAGAGTQRLPRFLQVDRSFNTTLGSFMASLDGSIILISLPAIFHGIGINALGAGLSRATCSGR